MNIINFLAVIALCTAVVKAASNRVRIHQVSRAEYDSLLNLAAGKREVEEARLITSSLSSIRDLAVRSANRLLPSIFGLGGEAKKGYPLCVIRTKNMAVDTNGDARVISWSSSDNNGGEGEGDDDDDDSHGGHGGGGHGGGGHGGGEHGGGEHGGGGHGGDGHGGDDEEPPNVNCIVVVKVENEDDVNVNVQDNGHGYGHRWNGQKRHGHRQYGWSAHESDNHKYPPLPIYPPYLPPYDYYPSGGYNYPPPPPPPYHRSQIEDDTDEAAHDYDDYDDYYQKVKQSKKKRARTNPSTGKSTKRQKKRARAHQPDAYQPASYPQMEYASNYPKVSRNYGLTYPAPVYVKPPQTEPNT